MTGEPAQLLPVCYRACVCVHACASVRAKKQQLPHTRNAHMVSYEPIHTGVVGAYRLLSYTAWFNLLTRCFCSETQRRVLLSRRCKTKSLPRCSLHRSHICVLLPSYITTLFTSWAANHRCNFHHPCEMARTSLPWYIHFIMLGFSTSILTQVIEHGGRRLYS